MSAGPETNAASIGDQNVTEHSALKIWSLHLMCFAVPLLALAYGLSGPHEWWVSLLFVVPILISVALDFTSRGEQRQPTPDLPRWPFDAVLYALAAIQVANVALAVHIGAQLTVGSAHEILNTVVELLVLSTVTGVSSGYSGFVVGHELIHRREPHMRLLGRLVLISNCYEHFATEHVRGHHPRVGTKADPATARFGETYNHFFARTVSKQFKSAWHLEKVRLGDEDMGLWDRRMLQHRVLQGVVIEIAMLVGITYFLGGWALTAFIMVAGTAIRLLEAVNYFEHWGLTRRGKGVRTMDSWDTDSWFTLYTLVGLSRHADHHATAARPYQQLRYFEDSPKLPYGYFGMVVTAVVQNEKFQRLMTEELQRKKLGPFYEEPSSQVPVAQPLAAE